MNIYIHPEGCYTGVQVQELVDSHLAEYPDRETYRAAIAITLDSMREAEALRERLVTEGEVIKKLSALLTQARDRIDELCQDAHKNAVKAFIK